MTLQHLIWRNAVHHWRTNIAVLAGVATAVSVLAGALLVGNSVRGSLRDLAMSRLGRAELVISSTDYFRDALAADVQRLVAGAVTAPMIVASGFVTQEASGRRASGVFVYGVDERFWAFHGRNKQEGVLVSAPLMSELGAAAHDVILLRLQKPSAIPVESLFGRKDDIARMMRLTIDSGLLANQLDEFSLQPRQSDVRAIFVPLARIQRELGLGGRVNTILAAGVPTNAITTALRNSASLEDLGATAATGGNPPNLIVESHTGIMSESLEHAAVEAGKNLGWRTIPIFTYLANTIQKGDRQIPYSLVSAVALDAVLPSSSPLPVDARADRIVLNDWAARELNASPGDSISIDYFLWDAATGLTTHRADFTLARTIPIGGLAADRRLAPEYPGITAAISLSDWDPPFPVDFSRVRPQDEAYWKQYRTTPKAFIDFERGEQLWRTRFGASTSVRFVPPDGIDLREAADRLRAALRPLLPPQSAGLSVRDVRHEALAAASGATDFGAYFTYFSFFIVVAALLLTVLFFRLGVEQRLRQIGILRTAGFTVSRLRALLLAEVLLLAIVGSALGIAGAMAYGELMMFGLRTWWFGAVGTTRLSLHVSWTSLVIGAVAGIATAIVCITLSLRSVARLSPRALLNLPSIDDYRDRASWRIQITKWLLAIGGAGMLLAGFTDQKLRTGMFFGAGASLLGASMYQVVSWLRARHAVPIAGRGLWPMWRLGFRSAAFRPSRSVMAIALISSAAFIIVAVDAFRRGEASVTDIHSGTGGFALLAQSEVPILANPNDAAGREALVVNAPDFTRVKFSRFRLRPGDDASCVNLYRPVAPTIIAPEPGFLERGRFSFASSSAETDAERANPWLLLRRPMTDAVPAIADATSLEYVLHASVGDTFSMEIGGAQPVVFRFVAATSDSILQGQLIISEENFVKLFPAEQGYRFFLIDDPSVRTPERAETVAGILEHDLAPFGFDAVSTTERLAAFHRVENTYLSTFQALGGLGLLLGTIGLSAIMFRNVLERRRELALLAAVGYDRRQISTMIRAEAALLVGAGVAIGAACAAIAIAPAWTGHQGGGPGTGLAFLLGAVIVAGLLSSSIAVRAALRGRLLSALSAE